jgi:glutamyl-tRNA synthetase
MEDTDEARNTAASRQTIFDGLRWLHLDPDEGPEQGGPCGPYSQSERGAIYAQAVEELKRCGAAYPCFCTKERLREVREHQEANKLPYGYDQKCRAIDAETAARRLAAGEEATLRLRVPPGVTVINDLIRGEISVDHAEIEDLILVRADGTPIYNFAVVIDDHHMGITLVMRGEDHLTNTSKQILLYRMLSWEVPEFAHLPLILGPSGEGKLSKRKHPEAALEHYIARGYHPEAMVNWLARLGWSLDDHTEILSRDQLIEHFRVDRISKGGARLNLEKLESLSAHYIRTMERGAFESEVGRRLLQAGLLPRLNDERIGGLAALIQERTAAFGDIPASLQWALAPLPGFEAKAEQNLSKDLSNADLLTRYAAALPATFGDAASLEEHARAFVAEAGIGFGKLVHPVRAAATGRAAGPPLFDCLVTLGRETCRERFLAAATWLKERSASG